MIAVRIWVLLFWINVSENQIKLKSILVRKHSTLKENWANNYILLINAQTSTFSGCIGSSIIA